MGNITVDTEFVQFDPANPDAPSSFTGSFGISYTGPAPSQSLAGSDLSFLFSPAVTTVSLSGISVPDTIAVGDDIWNLCHTCYDFRVTSLSGGKLEGFTVIDSETREEIKSEDGVFRGITGPVEFQHEGGIEASSHFIVSIDNIEACYCVPEPSTASLSLLALACLVSRRKR